MVISLSDFESMSDKDKRKILKELKNEIGVSGIAKAWEISRTKVYSMLHAFNVPVDSRRGRQPKNDKTSPEKELDKPVKKMSSNNNHVDQENNTNSSKPSLEPEKETEETKFSFYLDTQGTGTFVSETLQLLIASGKLSNSVLRLNISIEEM
jgi:hypothetical protein